MDETGDGTQTGLSAFEDGTRSDTGEGDERDAAAEAAAVAGNGGDTFEIVDLDDIRYPDADEYVTFAVTQIDYTVEGRGDDEFPVVHLFGRTPGAEELVHVEVYEFRPYFYAPTDSLTDADLQRDRITGWEEEDEDGEPYESIRGERLTKIFGQTPRDVGQMRDEYDHYEADILFPNRLLIDKDITSGVRVPVRREAADEPIRVPHEEIEAVDASAQPRVNTFDIEVDDRQGFPEDGEEKIVCLTSHDSYDDEYITWLFDADEGIDPPEALAAYDPIEDDFEADVRVFEEEEAMLEAFVDYLVQDTDPDLVTGWNCLPADSEVSMADGTVREIQDVQVGDEVVGNDQQQTAVAEVTNKWESEKEVLEFDLADGTSLRSSGDHRIMIGDDERVDWKRGNDVEPGDYVLKPRKLNIDSPTIPALSELVPTENQRFIDKTQVKEFKSALPHGAVTELADEFEVTKETLYHPKTDVWTPERCRTAADTYEVPLPDGGREYRRNGIELDREISETEVYLAGLVLTDGTMSTDDGIRFYNTREELHEQFPGDTALQPDGKGCYKQDVLDWARMHVFNGLGIPLGDKNEADVDLSQVYELPEEYVARFLAGVIDGDGSVSSSVVVAAENRSIGEWYTKLFRRLGIYAQQRENIVRVPDAERDLNRVQRDILPHMNHPEKVEAIEALEGGKSGQSETVPYALFEAETGSDEKRIGRDKHRRGINLKRHETTSEQWEEYVFVAVEDVNVTGTETTYDIETTTHNFVADNCLVHNCDDFDVPYLLDRLEELQGPHHDYDLSAERLSRVNEVWRNNWQGPNIKGRVVFDLLYAYQRTKFTELDSYRLDAVGEQELGVGKERYPGDIGDLWEDDPERLLEYNLRDVELCVELNEQQEIIPFWQEVASFVGCKLEDATTPGDAVDMYVLHKLHGNLVLPSKGQHDAEDYEGGAVFDPITGVREMVTVLDLKCFSADTDVLTPDGPRNITEIDEGEDVYTLNPETFECEVKPVAETHEYENKFGELHHLSGNTHDFKITENHRMLYSKERGWDEQDPADFEFDEYRDIPDYERYAFPQHESMSGRSPETFDLIDEVDGGHVVAYYEDDLRTFRHRMPEQVTDSLDLIRGSSEAMGLQKKVGKYLIPLSVYQEHRDAIEAHADEVSLKYEAQHRETPLSFEMSNWLELVGWYVTEGSADEANRRITIHQDEGSERQAIRRLLDEMGINHSVDDRGVNVSNAYLLDWFVENCGKGYSEKRLPEWVFELDGELLAVLLNTMIRGDGSRADSGLGKFWTKSEALKDGFATVAVRCGHKPTVSKQSDGTWYVSVGKRGSFKKSTNATVEEHDGNVHCITAEDNHVVLAGRNGNFQWIGQSLYPMCMVTINASPETKVDPDAYEGDTFRAPNGQHFRKEPDGVIREMVDELLSEREEKKSLRNDHDPDSSEYEQFDRQQAAVKVIMNCFTPDTDVLTPDGVRNIRDLDVGDEVYSLDPDTMEMEVKPVVETHAYPDYRGDLVDIETNKIDFSVTPNHRMLVRKNETNGITEDEYDFVEAGDLDDATNYELPHDWDGPDGEYLDEVDLTEYLDEYEVWVRPEVHGHTFAAEIGYYPDKVLKNDIGEEGYVFGPGEFEANREYIESVAERTYVHAESGRKWIPRTFDGDDFLDLLAWYITEGNVYTSETKEFGEKVRGSATTIKIAQEAIADGGESHHDGIGDLLDRMGFDYYVDDRSYQFTSRLLGDFLERLCGTDSFEKRIPEFVFECSQRQKRRFLDTLIDGDGDRQENSWRYSTASERLRDDVLRLCTHLGLTASFNEDSGAYRIYVTEDSKNTLRMHRSSERSTADDGVYCVTVEDNHTLMAGRNGKLQFVGQSLYGVLGWDRFRLYDKEMGAAVTATGRDVIEYTDKVVENEGYKAVYGDTDSVMLELGSVSPDDVEGEVEVTDEMREKHPEMGDEELRTIAATIQKGFELEEVINESYDDFALEQLNAEFHRFEIEFEKLYRRFFQAGKKKRYAGHIVWKEGKDVDDIDITGFEYQRSDIAPITKEVQKEVIDRIVKGADTEDIKDYVHEVIQDFEAGQLSLDDIAIPGGIGKKLDNYDTDTAQVRGAKYANLLLGTNFSSGSKPKRLYLDRVHSDFWDKVEAEHGLDPSTDPLYGEFRRDPDVICFEYEDQVPEEFEVDWEKMLDKTLKGPIERILEALDISWDEVKSGQEQTGLGNFM